MIHWPEKSPATAADYLFDWSGTLAEGEAIAERTVVGDGVTVVGGNGSIVAIDEVAGQGVSVQLAGGVLGTIARVTCTITTNSVPSRTFDEVAVLPIGGAAISFAAAKAYLKVEHDDDDDEVAAALRDAIDHVERSTDRILSARVVRQRVHGFTSRRGAAANAIALVKGPAREIVQIEYDDGDGVATTLGDYRLIDGDGAKLLPLIGESWPATLAGPDTVRIDYLAGYEPGELPGSLERAVKLLLGHFYRNREAVVVGTIASALPLGVDSLLERHQAPGLN